MTIDDAVRASIYLEGDDLYRASTGRIISPTRKSRYKQVPVRVGDKVKMLYYHRVKFFLQHGWWPPVVDHRDGDKSHNAGTNLRAATNQQNLMNMRSGPSRGVRKRKSGRYSAYATVGGKQKSLGTYDTYEEAKTVADGKRKEEHGEFYRG